MSAPTTSRPARVAATPKVVPPGGDQPTKARPRAIALATPEHPPLGGAQQSRPAEGPSTPIRVPPGGTTNGRRANQVAAPNDHSPDGSDPRAIAEPSIPSGRPSRGSNSRPATERPTPRYVAPAGASPQRTIGVPTPNDTASAGVNGRPAMNSATPVEAPPAGSNSDHAKVVATPKENSRGRTILADDHIGRDTHARRVVGDQPAARQTTSDTQARCAGGVSAGPGPSAAGRAIPVPVSLLDPALAMAADVLDDLERVRTANQNRLRQLTRSVEDADGEVRGLGLDESHPDVAVIAKMVTTLEAVEADAVRNLERHMRRHPLHPWAKSMRGVGDKQIARLLAVIGDPYIRPEILRDDGTVIPAGSRTVSALWAYCGYHTLPAGQATGDTHATSAGRDQTTDRHPDQNSTDAHPWCVVRVAARRAKGQRANWSTKAKTRAYLIAESCLKQLVRPCARAADEPAMHVEGCRCSPYRLVYDRRRAHTATTHPDWSDGRSHNDGLRIAAKEILKDLWRAARDLHTTRTGAA